MKMMGEMGEWVERWTIGAWACYGLEAVGGRVVAVVVDSNNMIIDDLLCDADALIDRYRTRETECW
jgi:hypothetical protein